MTTNIATTTTYFVGAYYEVAGSTVTKYYYAGAQRIAMRSSGTLYFVLGDHLGSTSLTTSATGTVISETRYRAWGEVRYASGTNPTKYTFTGQYSYQSDFGLMFYNARWVDVSLGRFAQADTVVPGTENPQAYDRYAYVLNNPIVNIDPSGHCIPDEETGRCNHYELHSPNPFYVSPKDYQKAVDVGMKASVDRGIEFVNTLKKHEGWWTPYLESKVPGEAWKFLLALSYALEGYSVPNPTFRSYLNESIINKAGDFYTEYGTAGPLLT